MGNPVFGQALEIDLETFKAYNIETYIENNFKYFPKFEMKVFCIF